MVINHLVTQALFFINEKIKATLILKNQIVHRQRCVDENSAGLPADMGGFQFKKVDLARKLVLSPADATW